MEKLRVFTAFSGYDSQCLSLERLKKTYPDFDYELVGWSEINKNAIKAHNLLFPQWADRNYGDISKIDWNNVPDFDLFTYSSPCQDFSTAGVMAGGEEGSGTRSSLLWECEKAIRIKQPKYLLMENVKNLVSNKFLDLFQRWLDRVDGYGYDNYWKVLNATDFGVLHNRERVFNISVKKGEPMFCFPQGFGCKKTMSDYLEPSVDQYYYNKGESLVKGLNDGWTGETKHYKKFNWPGQFQYLSKVHIDMMPTMTTKCIQYLVFDQHGEIRRFTERELFRFMGVDEKDIDILLNGGIKRTSAGELAGNSIVVDVLYYIFDRLLIK